MCGIIGYTGPLEARDLLLKGLAGLEYRGYDSAGIAYFDAGSKVRVVKKTGKVAAWVLDSEYEAGGHDPLAAIGAFIKKLAGSYSFCILFDDLPGELYAVRNVSPLVAAHTPSGSLAASDLTALIAYTKKIFRGAGETYPAPDPL